MNNIEISIDKIYTLQRLLNGYPELREMVRTWFTKKNYRSRAHEYRPGSEKHLAELTLDMENRLLPDYEVNTIWSRDLVIKGGYRDDIRYNIVTITIRKLQWDSDFEENFLTNSVYTVLVENAHWGHGIVTNMDELMSLDSVRNMLFRSQKEKLERQWLDRLGSDKDSDFTMLIDRIMEAEYQHQEIALYERYKEHKHCLLIGDKLYTMEYINQVKDWMAGNVPLYDSNDRLREWSRYGNGCDQWDQIIKQLEDEKAVIDINGK